MEVKDPASFSRKYDTDLILFSKEVNNLLKFVRKNIWVASSLKKLSEK